MTPETFKDWRKRLGLKQKEAADKLGLKKRVIQYYEKGHRDGKTVEIPKNVELACVALALGHERYDAALLRKAPPAAAPEDDGSDRNGSAATPPSSYKTADLKHEGRTGLSLCANSPFPSPTPFAVRPPSL